MALLSVTTHYFKVSALTSRRAHQTVHEYHCSRYPNGDCVIATVNVHNLAIVQHHHSQPESSVERLIGPSTAMAVSAARCAAAIAILTITMVEGFAIKASDANTVVTKDGIV